MKHSSHPNPLPRSRWFSLALVSLLAAVVLVACSQPAIAPDQAAARAAALVAVDDAFAGAAETDAADLASVGVLATLAAQSEAAQSGVPQLSAADVEPLLVIRRVRMHRERELLTLNYDGTSVPPSATAEVAIDVTGDAQIWQVYPDLSLPRTLVGSKPIALAGVVEVSLEGGDGGWHLTDIDSAGLTQGANAATLQNVLLDPDPLLTGTSDNLAYVTLNEPTTTDDFLVAARGRHLRPHGVLNDDGVPPDATADDDVYSGNVWVGADARPGTHLAFVTALNYSRTVNLSTTGDQYDDPYTDTVQPVLVQLAAGE